MTQGLSVGWGDTYDYYRFEQWIDLGQTTLEDGEYVLRTIADPLNKIHESPDGADAARESQQANEAITPFRVSNGALVDLSAPSGTVTINDIAEETSSPSVSVRVLGRDDISGVDQVRLSNDGSRWKSYAYSGSGSHAMRIAWSLSDPTYGGSATNGVRTVYAQSETGPASGAPARPTPFGSTTAVATPAAAAEPRPLTQTAYSMTSR